MKNITLLLFLLFSLFNVFAQDVSKTIEVDPECRFDSYGFTKNGNLYLKYNKVGEISKDKKGIVELYDTSLKHIYKYDVHKKFFISEITNDGEQIKSKNLRANAYTPDYKFLNSAGEIYNYKSTGYKTFKFKPKGFKISDDFISKNNLYLFGYYKVSKKVSESKKKLQFIKRNLTTKETKEIDFKLPSEVSSKGIKKFQLLQNFNSDNKITILVKGFENNELTGSDFNVLKSKSQNYIVLNYDEDLKLIDKVEFKVDKISEGLNFCNSNTASGSFDLGSIDKYRKTLLKDEWSNKSYTVYRSKPIASGNIIHGKDGYFYTYSSVTSATGAKTNDAEGGVWVNKFDSKGNLIWKNYVKVSQEKMSAYGPYVYLDLSITQDNIIVSFTNLYLLNRFNFVSILNKDTGELEAQKSFFKLKFDKPKSDGNKNVLTIKDLKAVKKIPRSDYRISKNFYKNVIVDKNTLMAYTLNDSFKNYIDSFKDKEEEFHFITTINYDSIITLEIYFKKSTYKLHKFNL